jgi:predicted RNA-binding protein
MQWLRDPNLSNLDNLNSARHEASRHFRNKTTEYLKAKIKELETNSKSKKIREFYRGLSDFKNGYQPRTNIVKDEKSNVVADSHSILVGGGIISLGCWMYIGIMMLSRLKYIQQNH